MAVEVYGLKYTSGDILRNGVTYKLDISERNYDGDALEIGDVQALSLEVQGGTGGIDQPIVKTLLHFTVVDSADMGVVDGVKHGGWEEFYTPDATLYQVDLRREGSIIWRGFITPDSWSDSLVYRGSVTVTARDNVGHMADFEFSKDRLAQELTYIPSARERVLVDGLVSVYHLIFAAFNVAGIAMTLRPNWDAEDSGREPRLMAGSYPAQDWLVEVEALADLNWYQAVEKVLVGAGLALRYVGAMNIVITSLRALRKLGTATPPERDVNFVNRSGHRTLDPAYKQIVEKLNYDAVEGYEATWAEGDFTETDRGYWKDVSSVNAGTGWIQADATKEVMSYGPPAVLPVGGDITGDEDRYLLLASRTANPQTTYNANRVAYIDLDNYVEYRRRFSPRTILTVGMDIAHTYKGDGSQLYSANLPAGKFRYAILWRKLDNSYLSLQGESWVSGVQMLEVDVNQRQGYTDGMSDAETVTISNNFQTPNEAGYLAIRIYPFKNIIGDAEREVFYDNDWVDAHIRLGKINFVVNSETVPRYFKTTTVYDPAQNYTLKRDVDFGAVPTRFETAGTVLNGFYKPDAGNGYPSIMNCHWEGSSVELPLPVLNHLQILSLHAKANSVLSGELRDADGLPIVLNAVWRYAGRKFLLLSGTWNILTDRIQNAILREFDTYAEAIGNITADYSTDLSGGDARIIALQQSANSAMSMAKAAGGGGGSPSPTPTPSGGTVTSVGLSMPAAFDVSGQPVTGAGTIQVSLKNQYFIPTLSQKLDWDAKSEVSIQNLLSAGTRVATLIIDSVAHNIYAPSSTPGSQVSIADLLSTGTLVATLTIDGWDYEIRVPTSSGGGGSVVSIDDLLGVGTLVATLTIDGDDYPIKVPAVTVDDRLNAGTLVATVKVGSNSYAIRVPAVTVGDLFASGVTLATINIGGTDKVVKVPFASKQQAGIVSTSAQAFAGAKTFDRIYLGNSEARGAYIEWDDTVRAFKIVGDIIASGDVTGGA